jgi:transcriptional regulator with PAS, ATPase and Fis domain
MQSRSLFGAGFDETRCPQVVGLSPLMQDVLAAATRTAHRLSKVLITGESGVGKDIVARYIHAHSSRADRPFVAVNCAGLTETLLESELFGHVRGSFTGAYRDKPGKLQLAHEGTIFLDEVGEMTPRMQALLLRFLESGEVQPVGADTPNRRVDARVITATNRNLAAMVVAGQFREDLLYRIRVIQIHVPPLRQRVEDIRPLTTYFLQRVDPTLTLTADAWRALEMYQWPGNVRELQSVVEQIGSLPAESVVDRGDLPSALRAAGIGIARSIVDRRKGIADELFRGLTSGAVNFWTEVYTMFMDRDLTRRDLRQLMSLALATTSGNYRDVVRLLGMPDQDYKRLLNFLVRHECAVDYRPFRRSRQPRQMPVVAPHPVPALIHAAV